jgi:pantoate--beta-alanine ligase
MICHTQTHLKNKLLTLRSEGRSIGFVPTMGALHIGHISLVTQALSENETAIVSIFVNPTQFNSTKDLEKYPRTLENDLELLKSSTDFSRIIVYAPQVEDVYGARLESKSYDFGQLGEVMEGAHRPGHFNGVGTILEYFFRLIEPDKAYFGEKDFQQLQVVKSLSKSLKLPIEIIGCSIQRESNMLAMSSRNERLTSIGRDKAGIIYQSLLYARKIYLTGNLDQAYLYIQSLYGELNELELEYFEFAYEHDLSTVNSFTNDGRVRAFIVVEVEGVRLIDNLSVS